VSACMCVNVLVCTHGHGQLKHAAYLMWVQPWHRGSTSARIPYPRGRLWRAWCGGDHGLLQLQAAAGGGARAPSG
jgi:hypothetical protein